MFPKICRGSIDVMTILLIILVIVVIVYIANRM